MSGLGRRVPGDWRHVEKYPYSLVAPTTTATVERLLPLPYWHLGWDQGSEGACVGFGTSMMMSIVNLVQGGGTRRYDPIWLWNQAKMVDEWPDTNPGDGEGTTVRAACDVLRSVGHVRVLRGKDTAPSADEGIASNRWATAVDEIRTAVASGLAVALGVNWYRNFDTPVAKGKEFWIGEGALGKVRGGHSLCLRAASDRRQAVGLKNSWGRDYPLVWLPYEALQRLLSEDGEATLVVDR